MTQATPTDDERWDAFKAELLRWRTPTDADMQAMLERIACEPIIAWQRSMFDWVVLCPGLTAAQLDMLAETMFAADPEVAATLADRRFVATLGEGPVDDATLRRALADRRARVHWAVLRNLALTQSQVAAIAMGGRTPKIRRVARLRLQQQFGWTGDA